MDGGLRVENIDESKMTKIRVRLRDPKTVPGHDLGRLPLAWPYIRHEIHILAETCTIDRPGTLCPVKGSLSWCGTHEDWKAAVEAMTPHVPPEDHPPGSWVCEHMIEIGD